MPAPVAIYVLDISLVRTSDLSQSLKIASFLLDKLNVLIKRHRMSTPVSSANISDSFKIGIMKLKVFLESLSFPSREFFGDQSKHLGFAIEYTTLSLNELKVLIFKER